MSVGRKQTEIGRTQRPRSLLLQAGDRVLVTGDHPWTGHTGEFVKIETLHALGVPGLLIQLDNGCRCYVTKKEHLVRL